MTAGKRGSWKLNRIGPVRSGQCHETPPIVHKSVRNDWCHDGVKWDMRFSIGRVCMVFLASACALSEGAGQTHGRNDEHKQLDWRAIGGCVVSFVNTPCRTVHYHQYSYGTSLGFDRTTRSEVVEATDQTGSESNTRTSTWRRWWFGPQRTSKVTELLLRATDTVAYIDHDHKVYETRPGAAKRGFPYWEEDDAQCSHTATHFTYLLGRLPDAVIAGVHVVGYRGRDFRGVEYEIYFAPSIGCQDLRFHMVKRGLFGWITAESDKVVDSYVLGPPSASLFVLPNGYRQVPSILSFQTK
jgi:hypothetical protein